MKGLCRPGLPMTAKLSVFCKECKKNNPTTVIIGSDGSISVVEGCEKVVIYK